MNLKEQVIKVVINSKLPVVESLEDGSFRIGNQFFDSKEDVEKTTQKLALANILTNIADEFELDWGYNLDRVEIRFK